MCRAGGGDYPRTVVSIGGAGRLPHDYAQDREASQHMGKGYRSTEDLPETRFCDAISQGKFGDARLLRGAGTGAAISGPWKNKK